MPRTRCSATSMLYWPCKEIRGHASPLHPELEAVVVSTG